MIDYTPRDENEAIADTGRSYFIHCTWWCEDCAGFGYRFDGWELKRCQCATERGHGRIWPDLWRGNWSST